MRPRSLRAHGHQSEVLCLQHAIASVAPELSQRRGVVLVLDRRLAVLLGLPEAEDDALARVDADHPLAVDEALLLRRLRDDLLLDEGVHPLGTVGESPAVPVRL